MNRMATTRVIYLGVALASSLAIGCGDHVVLGVGGGGGVSTSSQDLTAIDPAAVGGVPQGTAFGACNSGSEHPNVCCSSGNGGDVTCGVYVGDPFRPCPAGATTYPDPRSCCDLANPGSCTAPPAGSTPAPGACAYECPPGFTPLPPPDPNAFACCNYVAHECFGWSSSTFREEPDGAATPVPTPCSDCPPGFPAVAGEPGLCCGSPFDKPECFSIAAGAASAMPQGTGSAVVAPNDASTAGDQ
jgi:hypothetical protein